MKKLPKSKMKNKEIAIEKIKPDEIKLLPLPEPTSPFKAYGQRLIYITQDIKAILESDKPTK